MNASEHLADCAWKTPSSYAGFSPVGDYLILSRHRESDTVDRSNWEVACEQLRAEPLDRGSYDCIPADRPTVYHWRAGHCMVGWVEYLMVRSDAPPEVLTTAGEIVCALADYPILSDHHHSNLEWDEVTEYWARSSVRDRVDFLQDSGISVFAARRDEFPRDDTGLLFERLRG